MENGHSRTHKRSRPAGDKLSVVGKLIMIDCGGIVRRFSVQPVTGKAVTFSFSPALQGRILGSLLKHVRVDGVVVRDRYGRVTARRASRIETLPDKKPDLIVEKYKAHRTATELAREQGVKPVKDIRDLFTGQKWNADDGFEELLERMRTSDMFRSKDFK
jgi:hypothetical protein